MPATQRSDSKKPGAGSRPLSRERIVAAALDLADARGDFSMRALGRALGVDPMAIYRHYRDKQALQDAMVDAALAELEPPVRGTPLERLRRMCVDFRSALGRRPGVALRVSTTRPTLGPHTLVLTDACVGLIRQLGLPPREATRAFLMLIRYISGVANAEERVRAEGFDEQAWRDQLRAGYASLPAERFPNVAAMAGEVGGLGFEEEFAYGLDLLLEGLVRRGAEAGR